MVGEEPIAEVEHLTVRYGKLTALDDVTLRVSSGNTLIVGANGSGKSTLINTVLGLLRPRRGRVRLLGRDPFRENIAGLVTYVRDREDLPANMRLESWADHLASVYGWDRVKNAMEVLGLTPHKGKRVQELSRGLRRRAMLLEAAASDRPLVVVDEPFQGLDRPSREVVAGALAGVPGSLMITSHILVPIEFDYLIVLDAGRLAYQGPYREDIARDYLS